MFKDKWMQSIAPYYAAAGGGGGSAFTFQGSQLISGLPPGATMTYAVTMADVAAGARVVVSVGNTFASPITITSVVYDPAGANITLTQDELSTNSRITGVYSGVVTGAIAAGSKNIVVTHSANVQFADGAVYLWTITGSVTKQTSASGGNAATISVTHGNYMVGVSFSSGAAPDYALSTEVPTAIRGTTELYGPEWNTILADNASFSAFPSRAGSALGGQISVASYG